MENEIKKDMTVYEVIKTYPNTRKIFKHYGMDRIGCGWGGFSKLTIEQAAHLRKVDVDRLIMRLNKSIKG